jgi:hypothetical protein
MYWDSVSINSRFSPKRVVDKLLSYTEFWSLQGSQTEERAEWMGSARSDERETEEL